MAGLIDDILGSDIVQIIPFAELEVDRTPEDTRQLWRKWTRLALLAIDGMLVDMHGSVLNNEDVHLIHEVAWTADAWANAHERALEKAAPDPETPESGKGALRVVAPAEASS